MNKKESRRIGPGVRWFIFGGAPFLVFASVAIPPYDLLAHTVGERVAPYIVLGFGGVVWVATLMMYDHIPDKFVIPTGIVGWILAIAGLSWHITFAHGF